MRKIFVTGIGTDIGKTVISSILIEALHADYWKPIQAGNYFPTDSDKVKKWISNSSTVVHPERYILQQHMSPHAAAEHEGITIDFDSITLPKTNNTLIIEGAGGVMVPLDDKSHFVIDLIQKFDAETVVVIQNYLGSINHSILTIDALKHRKNKILGGIFNGHPHPLSYKIILDYTGVKLLGKVGKENVISKDTILKYTEEFRSI